MTVQRKAGSIKQGYWFGNKSTTVYLTVLPNDDPYLDMDANNKVLPDTGTWRILAALGEFGTLVYMNPHATQSIGVIIENFKYSLDAQGQMSNDDKNEMEDFLEAAATGSGPARIVDISANTGAWYAVDRSGATTIAKYGDGVIADITSHS